MAGITEIMALRAYDMATFNLRAIGAGPFLRLLEILQGGAANHAVFGLAFCGWPFYLLTFDGLMLTNIRRAWSAGCAFCFLDVFHKNPPSF